MKHGRFWVATLALALASATVHGQPEPEEQAKASACAATAKSARTLMNARQQGVPAEDMMAPVLSMPDERPAKQFLIAMTLDAYERDRWASPEMQQRAVEDFGNDWYMACLKR